MNANELADALDWVCENHLTGIGDADFKATATMLRQQQAEIDRLTMLCDCMTTESNRKGNEIEALKAGKIRAYDNGVEDGRKPNTHPVKELTDEEITEVITKIANNNEYVYSVYEDFEGIEFSRVGIFEFARAVIKEVSGK